MMKSGFRALGVAALMLGVASVSAQAAGSFTLAYVEWSDAIVASNILKTTLEDKGYTVKMVPLSAAAMWQAIATKEADGMVAAWLPATHAAYYAKLKDKVDLLGPNVEGAKIGWAVPDYVAINSMDDLKAHSKEFGDKVIGIDPGAGLMKASEKAITEYGLPEKLVEGSDASMVGALKDAYSRKEPIVVTAWTPHWLFATWKMKYLSDPKKVFGGDESVNTVARQGLDKDDPEAYKILKNFKLSLDDEQAVMVENEKPGADPVKTAKNWVETHKDKVAAWSK